MNLEPPPRTRDLLVRLEAFMAAHVYPAEQAILNEAMNQPDDFRQWQPLATLEALKEKAKAAGLWNLFLPDSEHGAGLTNLEYAPLAEVMGRSYWAPEVFNCDAPNTGNMETLVRYGSLEQQQRWLRPLLAGTIRSAYAMTEPDTASSDATNIRMTMRVEGDELVIVGRKWWTSGAGDPRCKILIVMGLTDPDGEDRHRRQSMVLVPTDTPGVRIRRYLPIIGVSDSPHGHMEVIFDNVRVPLSNVLLGLGRGFEIAQGRLGPGRIHHCMRMIGIAERALERICRRLSSRTTFGTRIADQSLWRWRIAEVRCRIEQARLLTLKTAWMMDTVGNKAARAEIAMIKIVAPRLATEVVDMAIQAFGGGGFADGAMTMAYIYARTTCVADGPDEVHANQLARFELGRWLGDGADTGGWSDVTVTQGRDHEVAA